jgi:RNA polymerase sigma-54 factor
MQVMRPALQLRFSQQLTLTPQLRMAIRMLQLSSLELEQEIQAALESNPMLESPEELAHAEPPGEATANDAPSEGEPSAQGEASSETGETVEATDYGDMESSLEMGEMSYGSSRNDDDENHVEVSGAVTEGLRDHLLWQLNLSPMSERDRMIGAALIESIDDDGYLREPFDSIQATLAPFFQAGSDEIEAVLRRVQHFDPLGVAARDLRECLGIQLSVLADGVPGLNTARALASEHLETLARNDRPKLLRTLRCEAEELETAIALIRSLDPRPGAQIQSDPPEFVVPDAYALRREGRWRVSLNPDCQPRLAINQHYASLVGKASRGDAGYLRGQLQEARWLIKSLETRSETLLKVASCIVEQQQDFLEYGPEAMKPMVLRDVAERIEMHESTVSRVTTRKYLYTPRGTFEFKYFFSSHVGTADGGEASAVAIQAMIRKLIEAENPGKPLSDSALAQALNNQGINVARRTVAKYREGMNIPSSNDRVRLG